MDAAAYQVEHHVLVAQRAEVLVCMVVGERAVCAQARHVVAVAGAAGGRHLGTEMPAQLHHQTSHGARTTMHQHAHARLHLRGVHHGYPGADTGLHQGRSLVGRKAGGARNNAVRAAHQQLGRGAGQHVGHRAYRIAHGQAFHPAPYLVDHAHAVAAGGLGQREFEVGLQVTGPQLGVERRNASSQQPHAHLPRAGLWCRQAHLLQYLGRAIAVELDGVHETCHTQASR